MKVLSGFPIPVFPKISFPPSFKVSVRDLQRGPQQSEEFLSQVFMMMPEVIGNIISKSWKTKVRTSDLEQQQQAPNPCLHQEDIAAPRTFPPPSAPPVLPAFFPSAPWRSFRQARGPPPARGALSSRSRHGSPLADLFCLRPSLQFHILEVTEKL